MDKIRAILPYVLFFLPFFALGVFLSVSGSGDKIQELVAPTINRVLESFQPKKTPPSIPEIVARAKRALVTIVVSDPNHKEIGIGTGFFFDFEGGEVITNYHVVKAGFDVEKATGRPCYYEVVFDHGTKWPNVPPSTRAMFRDYNFDLVLLEYNISDETKRFLKAPFPVSQRFFAMDYIVQGERVLVIGHPDGLTDSVSDGIIAAVRRTDKSLGIFDLIQITAPISRGSSGSPVLDKSGYLIGIAVGSDEGGQSLNFAVPGGRAEHLSIDAYQWRSRHNEPHNQPLGGYRSKFDDPLFSSSD